MKGVARKTGGAFALLLVLLVLSGCSEPQAVPIANRPPGTDLSPEARADKRGDVPVTPPGGG